MDVEPGYFDPAHLIKDFKTVTGCSPRQYAGRHSISPSSAAAPIIPPKGGHKQ